MKISIISFTDRGQRLAELLVDKLEETSALRGDRRSAGARDLHDTATSVRCGDGVSLREWAAEAFACSDALIYVGAAGICVRSIAPHIRSKTTDPAVVVVDETGKYVIPVLSGHLGGANDLARTIAAITGGEAVITTATDRNNVFSVDAWARIQGCAVENPTKIKDISMKILNGQDIVIESDYPIEGTVPNHVFVNYPFQRAVPDHVILHDPIKRAVPDHMILNCPIERAEPDCATPERDVGTNTENRPFVIKEKSSDAILTIRRMREEIPEKPEACTHLPGNHEACTHLSEKHEACTHLPEKYEAFTPLPGKCEEITGEKPLHIVPRIVCAGVGCRKGISVQNVENAIRSAFDKADVSELALCGIFSIDLKKEEDGLKEFCRSRKIPFVTFSAEELAAVPGDFTSSAFVREVAGVDNVCERSAVLGSETDSACRSETDSVSRTEMDSLSQSETDSSSRSESDSVSRSESDSTNRSEQTSERCDSYTSTAPVDRLILRKYVYEGVTVALAVREFRPDFRWIEG